MVVAQSMDLCPDFNRFHVLLALKYKKLCYREEHSASVVLSWCTVSRDNQQINS